MNLVFLGPPGAGKGTQATQVCDRFCIPHISTGDILRANIKAGTPLGIKAKAFIDKGMLVPDKVVIDIIKERLSNEDCQKGYLLDGFPRTIEQAEALNMFSVVDLVVNIMLNEEMIIQRIAGRRMCSCGESYHISKHTSLSCDKCGGTLYQREDDKEDTVKARLVVYLKQTAPLIEYYSNLNKIYDVDGAQDSKLVFDEIVRVIDDKHKITC